MFVRRALSLLLTFSLLMTCCLLITNHQADATTTSKMKGIDVSSYQESIDFTKVADDGIKIVYIRACMGSDETDSYFEENYTKAKAAGLKIGFYQYVTATTEAEA